MASPSKPQKIYDVFLSFRGVDLRNNFIGHLYQALHQIGIYTFRDSEELKKGDQISPVLMKAIEESYIAIIVFSMNYASSMWCLEEVAKIIECKEQKNLIVLPVFYKVDPREVRGVRKSYQRALAKHESKFGKDSEKVKRWKEALSNAGNLSGWHLNDGDESELIQKIVEEISTYLARTPLHVAKHLVGIDSRVVKLIQRRLGRKKVLLILDDVDDLRQLNTLAEGKCFGNGSRIIVTIRDKHLLTCHRIDQDRVYEVEALDDSQARDLLTKHAFQIHQIRTSLVDSALNYAKGLPLALEVLGSLLCGTTEDVWESTLMKLSRIPDKKINSVLKVSYDGLDENEKEIFLHIACFFNGRTREYTKKVLDSCDLLTAVGFDTLIKRSLICFERRILKVHDLIQAMGKDIVNQECRDDPRRRRLCYKSHTIGTT
ncbi:hypothetical protein EUGRSUZ_E02290 [Eucalyptus grandis]|uniref:TIR domain-containing protein n=2 Tax=Eucalyptus grandis TaxID=71139 RepID=A0A059C5P5_EUCGR|nr:hypothetical protein EUGRSUZ_E02290 [Eucalyptus grandis]